MIAYGCEATDLPKESSEEPPRKVVVSIAKSVLLCGQVKSTHQDGEPRSVPLRQKTLGAILPGILSTLSILDN